MIVVSDKSWPDPYVHDPWCFIGCEHDEALQVRINEERQAEEEITTLTVVEELPNQEGPRYPLAPVDRSSMSIWALLVFWVRLLRWKRRASKMKGAAR